MNLVEFLKSYEKTKSLAKSFKSSAKYLKLCRVFVS